MVAVLWQGTRTLRRGRRQRYIRNGPVDLIVVVDSLIVVPQFLKFPQGLSNLSALDGGAVISVNLHPRSTEGLLKVQSRPLVSDSLSEVRRRMGYTIILSSWTVVAQVCSCSRARAVSVAPQRPNVAERWTHSTRSGLDLSHCPATCCASVNVTLQSLVEERLQHGPRYRTNLWLSVGEISSTSVCWTHNSVINKESGSGSMTAALDGLTATGFLFYFGNVGVARTRYRPSTTRRAGRGKCQSSTETLPTLFPRNQLWNGRVLLLSLLPYVLLLSSGRHHGNNC